MKRYLAAGLLICALCGGAGAEENQPSFMSLDDIVENNIKGWGFYDPCTNDDYSKEISLTPQTEKLHGTPKGLLITFKNVIKPTKLGDAENDKFRIVPFSDVKKFSNEIVKYTRLSCWAYVEGERNPLVGIMMYYNDPDTQKVKTLMDFIPAEPGKWTKLILRYDQLPLKVRGNLMKIAVFQYYMRPEIGDDKEGGTRLYLDDFRLEREEERQCYGTDADPRVVIVNKIGYGPNDKKTLVVNQNNPSLNFSVHESDSGKEVLSGPLDLSLTHYGPVKTGDFSSLRKEGKYFVKAGNIRSVDFAVDKNIYWDLAKIFRRVCYNSRVGCKTDKQDANFLDAAYRVDTGKHVDLVGGHADAGDVGVVYLRNTCRILFASSISAKAALNSGVSPADYIDEAGWAFKHIEKLVNEFGFQDIPHRIEFRIEACRPGYKLNERNKHQWYTDNISGTGDDPIVYGGKDTNKERPSAFLCVAQGLAMLSKMDEVPAELKNKCLSYAEKFWREYSTPPPEKSQDMVVLAPACAAAIEMYKATGDISYKDFAIETANKLLKNQKTALLVNKNLNITGYFHGDDKFGLFSSPHNSIILGQAAISALSQMCLSFPEHPDAFKWRAALLICRDFYINNLVSFQKPYGLTPYNMHDIKTIDFDYKTPGNEIFLGYDDEANRYLFTTYERWSDWRNPVYGQNVMSLARVFNDLSLQESARAVLGWPIGENQFNGSDVAEIGQDPLVQYYSCHGRLPGTMVCGNLRYDSYDRIGSGGRGTGYREIWIAITMEMMQLSAMLGEQFTLSGKITGSDGKVVVCNADDPEGFSQTITPTKDGSFGPLKLPGGCVYRVTSGKINRMIPAVSGGRQYVAFDSEGDLSVKALSIAQEAEVVNKTTKEMKSTPVAELIALETGVEATLTFQISRQGNHPGKGKVTLEAVNMDFPEAQLDFDMEDKDSKDFKVKLMPSKPGHAWAIRGKISGSDRFFELTGTTKPAVKEKK